MRPLTFNDTGPLVRLADHVALRLCRKVGLSLQEREDFRQDLLLNLLSRLKFYDRSAPNRPLGSAPICRSLTCRVLPMER